MGSDPKEAGDANTHKSLYECFVEPESRARVAVILAPRGE